MIKLILIKLLKIKSPSLTMIPGMKDIPDMTYSELWRSWKNEAKHNLQ